MLAIAARTGNRSGIYHYARSLERGLMKIDNISLHPICSDLIDIPWAWIEERKSAELGSFERMTNWLQFLNYKKEILTQNANRRGSNNNVQYLCNGMLKAASDTKIYNAINRAYLRHQIDSHKSKLFHSPFHLVPRAVGYQKNLTVVRTIHDMLPLQMPSFFMNESVSRFREAINSIGDNEHIICISNKTRRDLVRHLPLFPANHIHVVSLAGDAYQQYAGGDEDWELFCAHYGLDNDDMFCLTVGTIEPRKNHLNLIAGLEIALKTKGLHNLKLVIVGKVGWKAKRIIDRIRCSSAAANIILLGSVPDVLLDCLYKKAVLTLFVSWAEGFGLPVLESMKVGTPVIASKMPVVEEAGENSVYLTDPASPDAIANAISNLIKSKDLQKLLSKRGIESAQQFSWQKTSDATAKVYSNILA